MLRRLGEQPVTKGDQSRQAGALRLINDVVGQLGCNADIREQSNQSSAREIVSRHDAACERNAVSSIAAWSTAAELLICMPRVGGAFVTPAFFIHISQVGKPAWPSIDKSWIKVSRTMSAGLRRRQCCRSSSGEQTG